MAGARCGSHNGDDNRGRAGADDYPNNDAGEKSAGEEH